jgi:dienelactone hydrolase
VRQPSLRVRFLIPALVVCGLLPATASTAHESAEDSPRILLSRRRVRVDRVVDIELRGLPRRELVQLRLTLERGDRTTWASQAFFRADRRGRVDLATTAPVQGDYRGVDPMGLLWSAQLQPQAAHPQLKDWTDQVHLSALVDGRQVASANLERSYLRAGTRVTSVRDRGLVGTLFEPPAHRRRPALIVVGGSEGGIAYAQVQAAMFASHGYDVLALAYFDPTGSLGGGLPRELSLIPLEYFGTAIDWLGHQPTVDADRIGIVGTSKGAELALLLGSRYPQLKAVAAYAPSSVAWPGIGTSGDVAPFFTSSWSEHGRPVPFLPYHFGPANFYEVYRQALDDPAAAAAAIPVERINGPVLLISGNDDQLWPSSYMAEQVIARLRAHSHAYPDRHLAYNGAGHGIGFPYEPTTQLAVGAISFGGNPAGIARADRDHWPRLLQFLADTLERDCRSSVDTVLSRDSRLRCR